MKHLNFWFIKSLAHHTRFPTSSAAAVVPVIGQVGALAWLVQTGKSDLIWMNSEMKSDVAEDLIYDEKPSFYRYVHENVLPLLKCGRTSKTKVHVSTFWEGKIRLLASSCEHFKPTSSMRVTCVLVLQGLFALIAEFVWAAILCGTWSAQARACWCVERAECSPSPQQMNGTEGLAALS